MTEFLAFLIITGASIAQGCFGIGVALIGLPFLSLLYPTKFVVGLLHLVNVCCTGFLAFRLRKSILKKEALLLCAISLPSIFIGAHLYKILPVSVFRTILAMLIILASLSLMISTNWKPKKYWSWIGGSGLVGGIFGGLLGLSGPPVVLIFTGLKIPKDPFRATLSLYFFVIGVIVISINTINGLFTSNMVHLASWMAPVALSGIFIGSKIARFVSGQLFRNVILIMLIVSAMFLLIKS